MRLTPEERTAATRRAIDVIEREGGTLHITDRAVIVLSGHAAFLVWHDGERRISLDKTHYCV